RPFPSPLVGRAREGGGRIGTTRVNPSPQPSPTRGEGTHRRCGDIDDNCPWPGAAGLPPLPGAAQEKHALFAEHVPEPPGRAEPQRPAIEIERDRALHLDVDLAAQLHEIL